MASSPSPLNGGPKPPTMTKEGLRRRLNVSKTSAIGNGHAKDPSKRKKRSLPRRCKRFAVKHTWTLPLAFVLAFLSLYAQNPSESNIIHHFIFLSYKQESDDPTLPTQYGKGLWDIAFVSFYVIVLSFTREFIMQEILRPLARLRIKSHGKQSRFMEQAYTAIYFAVLGPAGLYVMRQTPVWYFNTSGMYEAFPHRTHAAEFKFYYLFEAAYWAQQAIVMLLGMEKPRKDFKELVTHHIVTLALIALSYRFHFTYMGIAIYITHDISDFFLAVSPICQSITTTFKRANHLSGFKIPPLLRPGYNDPLLCSLNGVVDLPPSCNKPAHSLLPSHRVPDCGALRTQLGDAAVQMLDLEHHHILIAGCSPGPESVLVVLLAAQCFQVPCHRRKEG